MLQFAYWSCCFNLPGIETINLARDRVAGLLKIISNTLKIRILKWWHHKMMVFITRCRLADCFRCFIHKIKFIILKVGRLFCKLIGIDVTHWEFLWSPHLVNLYWNYMELDSKGWDYGEIWITCQDWRKKKLTLLNC